MASSKPHCYCSVKESCPLNSDCLQSSVAYICKITSNDTAEDPPHIGLTENTIKDNAELSNYVWDRKKDKQETSLN